jgi:hypothetical protein
MKTIVNDEMGRMVRENNYGILKKTARLEIIMEYILILTLYPS